MFIPGEKSGSTKLELLVADPEEGFHLLMQEDENYARHFLDFSEIQTDEPVHMPLGKIEKFSLSANKKLMAIYANKDRGTLTVLKSDLT